MLIDVAEIFRQHAFVPTSGTEHVDVLALVNGLDPLEQNRPLPRYPGIGRDSTLAALKRAMIGHVYSVESGSACPLSEVVVGPAGSSVVRVFRMRMEVDGHHG